MTSAAFRKAERVRQQRRPANAAQKRTVAYLARTAEMEIPRVFWSSDANEVRQPTLGPMG